MAFKVNLSSWFGPAQIIALAMACIAVSASSVSANDDAAQIAGIIKKTWEKPDAPIAVRPISMSGDYAIAGWIQGERGGRALLKRAGSWAVILCSGDGIRDATAIQSAGVPEADAKALAAQLAEEEQTLSAAERAKFALFEGSVAVDSEQHAPHDHHHHH